MASKYTYIFDFGQHKDQRFDEIIKENPDYLLWLHKQDWVKEKKSDLYEIIECNLEEIEKSANTCPFCCQLEGDCDCTWDAYQI